MYRNLLAEMKRIGLRQIDLAKEVGMSTSTLSQKLAGKRAITLNEALKIKVTVANHLTIEQLFCNY